MLIMDRNKRKQIPLWIVAIETNGSMFLLTGETESFGIKRVLSTGEFCVFGSYRRKAMQDIVQIVQFMNKI